MQVVCHKTAKSSKKFRYYTIFMCIVRRAIKIRRVEKFNKFSWVFLIRGCHRNNRHQWTQLRHKKSRISFETFFAEISRNENLKRQFIIAVNWTRFTVCTKKLSFVSVFAVSCSKKKMRISRECRMWTYSGMKMCSCERVEINNVNHEWLISGFSADCTRFTVFGCTEPYLRGKLETFVVFFLWPRNGIFFSNAVGILI